ncbi:MULTISPECIES: hypothetical protein [Paenibacillus]|uniref:Copper amine oxidase-like N-terminal domain-containing protein n=1 Tax=Paenibacillus cucumis (ex Kampfer et al. 2016) TaxID=1776858 RepID=A0ABS7KNE0_9BACL|nr:hypothetical protein [Paenibacillus cucumis (ex Kampfer et al. 2016)]MBY0205688.1 hypothetical protein [Paenibacillus cucumis (ex Kampfer et al. 2016)]MDP9701998.1 hypothetical protein [Paenibacillus intestini]
MSKAKKVFLPLLLILSIFSLSLSPNLSITAKADNSQNISVVIGNEAKELINATLSGVEKGEIRNVAPVSAFDLEKSSVYTVGGGVTVVTVPVHGEYSLPSNVTVFFNEDDTVLQTNEMLVTKNEAGNFRVETYLNGSVVKSVDTDRPYITDEEMLAEEPVNSGIQPNGFGAVAGCLGAVLGIGGTAAYIIAVACGSSCAVPTPVTAPICAACIGAYAVIGAGGIAGAVACFNYL